MYYSLQDVCELTRKSRNQVSFLISSGVLQPVNPQTWRADGGYRFRKEDVDLYIKEQNAAADSLLSLSEAAEYVGRSKSFIQQAVENGILSYEEVKKRKRNMRLYNRKELDKIKAELSEKVRKAAGVPFCLNELVLFDQVMVRDEKVRVLDVVERRGITSQNTYVTIPENINSEGIMDKPYYTAPGTITFLFPIAKTFHNNVLDTIAYLIKHVGAPNFKIWKLEHEYKVQVRLISIPFDEAVMRILLSFIAEGEVVNKKNMISFTTGKKKMTIHLSKSVYNQIEKDKETSGFETPASVVEHIINEHYEKRTSKGE